MKRWTYSCKASKSSDLAKLSIQLSGWKSPPLIIYIIITPWCIIRSCTFTINAYGVPSCFVFNASSHTILWRRLTLHEQKIFYINKIYHQKNCIKDNTSKVVSLILGANGKQQKKRKKNSFYLVKSQFFAKCFEVNFFIYWWVHNANIIVYSMYCIIQWNHLMVSW